MIVKDDFTTNVNETRSILSVNFAKGQFPGESSFIEQWQS